MGGRVVTTSSGRSVSAQTRWGPVGARQLKFRPVVYASVASVLLSAVLWATQASPATGQTSCAGLAVTVNMSAGQTPTNGDDVILGTAGADVIVALGGNDTICGLGGDDAINAGPGDDVVRAGDGNDTVFGLDGNDEINGDAGNDNIIAGAGDDTVNGLTGSDTINGGPGNDNLYGAADDDIIFGQDGADTINGNGGDDQITGADGADNIHGGPGDDIISAGPGNDIVNGAQDDDTIFGLGGNDELNGGADNDIIFGQSGVDTINGNGGDDRLLGNEGDDILTDPTGSNVMNGGAGDDEIVGGDGNDQIFGDGNNAQAGNDDLSGRGGEDLILGFAGSDAIRSDDFQVDIVNGGAGGDVCTTDEVDPTFNCEITEPEELIEELVPVQVETQGDQPPHVCNSPLGTVELEVNQIFAESISVSTTLPAGLDVINGQALVTADVTPHPDGRTQSTQFAARALQLSTGQEGFLSAVTWAQAGQRNPSTFDDLAPVFIIPTQGGGPFRIDFSRRAIGTTFQGQPGVVSIEWALTVPACSSLCSDLGGDVQFLTGDQEVGGCLAFGPEAQGLFDDPELLFNAFEQGLNISDLAGGSSFGTSFAISRTLVGATDTFLEVTRDLENAQSQ